ncbi:MAG TPA: phenylacetate--CoA ligase [Clostridiales bacterium]|nr:phenylacetate--CoA ligase [Clostridiales bacterium]
MENWQALCRMPADRIRNMQDRKLRAFIRTQIYPYSPYYQRIFRQHDIDPYSIQTVDDLAKLPFTFKEDVAPTDQEPERHKDFVVRPDETVTERYGHLAKLSMYAGKTVVAERVAEYRPVHIHFTTGRTARPTPFVYSARDLGFIREGGYRLLNVFGLQPQDRVVNAFPYAPHLAFWQTYFAAEAQGSLVLHSGGGKIMGTPNLMDAVETLGATVLVFIPGYAYFFLREAVRQGRDFRHVRLVLFGGERVPPGLKEKVREALGKLGAGHVNVLATYACTESRLAWAECPAEESHGYHTYPDLEIIEAVDPDTGRPVGEGESGEIVYTALDWRGTCVLRYRTGDIAAGGITYRPCPNCGRTVPRISANIQRRSEFREFALTKIKGTLVNLNNFFPLLMGHPDLLEWQVELRKRNDDPYDLDEIYLRVVPRPEVNVESLKADLRERVLRETEVAPTDILLTAMPEMLSRLGMETELKEKRIVDNRPRV